MQESSAKRSTAPHPPYSTSLVIDPGGVRGIQAMVYMAEIARRMGRPISECFDLGAFTSTGKIAGGIVTVPDPLNPSKPRYSADFGVMAYHDLGEVTFSLENLKVTLRQLFGKAKHDPQPFDNTLCDILEDARVWESLISVMYFANDVETSQTVCIKHIRNLKGEVIEENLSNMRVRDVISGGVTAPTVFPVRDVPTDPDNPAAPHKSFMDAGASAGNVLHEVWHTLGRMAPGTERVILHLGTGRSPLRMTTEKYNWRSFVGFLLDKDKREHFLSMAFNAAGEASVRFMKRTMGDRFISLNAVIDPSNPDHPTMRLDDGRKENMAKHIKLAQQVIAQNSDEIDRLCDILRARLEQRAPQAAPAHESPAQEKSGTRWTQPEKLREIGGEIADRARRVLGRSAPQNDNSGRKKLSP